jgi:HAD superfamily hydrolase (TIGR01509 family)
LGVPLRRSTPVQPNLSGGTATNTVEALVLLKAVIFDMDGTLTDSPLDFERIRAECGVPAGRSVLEHLATLPEPERRRAEAVLAEHERRAAAECVLKDGARETVDALRSRGLKTALLTRNSAESVRTVLGRLGLAFDCRLSREDAEPKPSPDAVLRIARRFGVRPQEVLMVGDYVYDVQAGRAAGARTVLLRNPKVPERPPEADYVIDDLRELLAVVGEAGQ